MTMAVHAEHWRYLIATGDDRYHFVNEDAAIITANSLVALGADVQVYAITVTPLDLETFTA